jgi:hypothetical protein
MMPDEKNSDNQEETKEITTDHALVAPNVIHAPNLIQLKEELKNELREEFLRSSPKPSTGSLTHFFIKNRVAICVGIIIFLFGLALGTWIGDGGHHSRGHQSFKNAGQQHGMEGSNRKSRGTSNIAR